MYLEHINSPSDVKAVPADKLGVFANEIRDELIRVVSQNGGHLAANLGVVELTVAMHRVFDCPTDSFVFDVGHQSYVHKLFTGRREQFESLRTYGGLAGFPKISESECDAFGCGHSSTSISAAIGIATAKKLAGDESYTVAVIGDGAFTGGMAYEALNNCANNDKLIIVLNDNTMSIAQNVGAMNTYLNRFRNTAKYFRLKNRVKQAFLKVPAVGKGLVSLTGKVKEGVKHLLVRENFFEHLGLSYYGPLDGNDESLLETVLREAKKDGKCAVVHIITKKGKGYRFAEERPDLFHGIGKFDIETGKPLGGGTNFSEVFGQALCEIASEDKSVCAISAAMPDGTGLTEFAKTFGDRFFDVGIAEEHAVTFACGLAAKGAKPVFAVYSTFAQRAYDQILHDAALQNLPITLALDRAGLVGADGATHHGIFDVAFLNQIPSVSIYSPETYEELHTCLREAIALPSPSAVRYPRGKEEVYEKQVLAKNADMEIIGDAAVPQAVIFTYGRMAVQACKAALLLKERGIRVRVVKLIRIKPFDAEMLARLAEGASVVYVLEEGIREGGFGEALLARFAELGLRFRCRIRAIEGVFPAHGDTKELYRDHGFLPEQVAAEIEELTHADAD